MTQAEFHAGPTPGTQNAAVLERLTLDVGTWVGMPDLAQAARCYAVHSRVSDLRRMGYRIEHRSERDGRRVLSFYRLSEPQIPDAAMPGEQAA